MGMDYDEVPSPDVLVFPTSSTEGMILCSNITIIDDYALEGEHNFTVKISSAFPEISTGIPNETTISLEDNEGS